jgi:hypothetical protein
MVTKHQSIVYAKPLLPLPKKKSEYANALYIFSNGAFQNLGNTFEGSKVATYPRPSNLLDTTVPNLFLRLVIRRSQNITHYSIVSNPTEQAVTMAALATTSDCFMGRIRTGEDVGDLACYSNYILQLLNLVDTEDYKRSYLQTLLYLSSINSLSVKMLPSIKSASLQFDKILANQNAALALAWDEFDKQFKVNK